MEVRVWQEDENPGELVAKWLATKVCAAGRMESTKPRCYAYYDKLETAAPGFEYVLGDPITAGCRMRKSEHELELMRLACSATTDVYRAIFASVKEGMTQYDVSSLYYARLAKHGIAGR